MSDTTMTEDEARRESEKERLAEVARLKARREAAQREDRLAKEQADRLAEQPDELRREHERLRSRQRQFDDYNAEQRRIAEAVRKRKAEQEAEVKEAEIRDAKSRYAESLGDYDIRDPYGSLARAAMAEYVSFRRDRQELTRQIATENDPAKRRTHELRRDIEYCDYITITSHRIAGQSEVIVGRPKTQEAERQRAQAKEHAALAKQLRAQYRQHIAEQQLGKDTEQDTELDTEPEQTQEPEQAAEPSPAAPTPRQRGPRTARGRAQAEAGDAETDNTAKPRRPQRGERTQEGTHHPQQRGPGLER
jgi:hypothetical protein